MSNAGVNPWDRPRRRRAAFVRDAVHRVRVAARDVWHNRRGRHAARRILVVRHHRNNWTYNDHFLRWLRSRVPEAAALFELRRADDRITDWDRYALFVPWLQDPVRERFPDTYVHVKRMQDACDARGIPVVNRVDALSNAIKSRASRTLRDAGIRTPRTVPIVDAQAFRKRPTLPPPFLVREDDRHGSRMVLVDGDEALARARLEEFRRPIAVEFVDARGPDGYVRKYRHVVIGDAGLPRHVRRSTSWMVTRDSRVVDADALAEQRRFVSEADPYSALLQRGRQALGLDVVAFDYGFDRAGEIVVFEPNPFAVHWYPYEAIDASHPDFDLMEVFYAELLGYHLARAGLRLPSPAVRAERAHVVVRRAG